MPNLQSILNKEIIENPDFIKATFSGIRRTEYKDSWNKITIEPVIIKSENKLQFNYFDTTKGITKNFSIKESTKELANIIAYNFTSIYLRSKNSGIQIQITTKNKILVKEHKNLDAQVSEKSHDKKKDRLIAEGDAYLQTLGITDAENKVKPTMQAKYKQISEFIKIIDKLTDWESYKQDINIVDCGAGNGYLTLAVYNYFKTLNKDISVEAIDIDADAVERNIKRVKSLNWNNIDFEVSNIISYTPKHSENVDITIALHACDTATDEALLLAIKNNSKFILSVPCCHHEIQQQLKNSKHPNAIINAEKHGIIIERQGDIIADTCRALLLEICGYKTSIIQYTSTEHTAKNLMIKAEKIQNTPIEGSVKTYIDFKNFWQIEPSLEKLLKATNLLNISL